MRLWLTQPPSRMRDSIGWALPHLSLFSSCQGWPNVCALCPQLSQISACLACTVHRKLRPTNCPVGWVRGNTSDPRSTPWHWKPDVRPLSGPSFLPSSGCRPHLSASNVPTSVQKHESASNMASDGETLTGSVPPFQMLCYSMLVSLDVLPGRYSGPLCLPVMGRRTHWANAN